MPDVKDTFIESPIDQGNVNWEKYYEGIDEHEKLWTHKFAITMRASFKETMNHKYACALVAVS